MCLCDAQVSRIGEVGLHTLEPPLCSHILPLLGLMSDARVFAGGDERVRYYLPPWRHSLTTQRPTFMLLRVGS